MARCRPGSGTAPLGSVEWSSALWTRAGRPQCRLASSLGRPLAERLVGLKACTWPMRERQGVGETLMEMAPSVISHCRDEEKQLRKFSLMVLVVSFIPRHSENVSDSGWGKKSISSAEPWGGCWGSFPAHPRCDLENTVPAAAALCVLCTPHPGSLRPGPRMFQAPAQHPTLLIAPNVTRYQHCPTLQIGKLGFLQVRQLAGAPAQVCLIPKLSAWRLQPAEMSRRSTEAG